MSSSPIILFSCVQRWTQENSIVSVAVFPYRFCKLHTNDVFKSRHFRVRGTKFLHGDFEVDGRVKSLPDCSVPLDVAGPEQCITHVIDWQAGALRWGEHQCARTEHIVSGHTHVVSNVVASCFRKDSSMPGIIGINWDRLGSIWIDWDQLGSIGITVAVERITHTGLANLSIAKQHHHVVDRFSMARW
eukprot:SAG31_NODE_2688_length_5250_cov_11.245583_1_plen_188_part_00